MQGSRKPTKSVDENIQRKKERKKRWPRKDFFDDRKDFVRLYHKSDVTNFDELRVNNYSHTKGTICLVNG